MSANTDGANWSDGADARKIRGRIFRQDDGHDEEYYKFEYNMSEELNMLVYNEFEN